MTSTDHGRTDMTSYERATIVAHEITARTGRAAEPIPDDGPRGSGWLVRIEDSGECVTSSNAAGYLAPRSMRRSPG